MDGVYNLGWTEVVTDLYRDFVLTGILLTLVTGAFRFGGLHTRVMSTLEIFDKRLEGLAQNVREGFDANNRRHEELQTDVADLKNDVTDRLARVEEATRVD